MAHDVFIANSHQDREEAEAVRRALEGAGVRCWLWSRDVVEGIDFGQQIEEAMETAKVLVIIWSRAAAVSSHVRKDIDLALLALETGGSFVIVFSIESIPDPWHGTRGVTPAPRHSLVTLVRDLLEGTAPNFLKTQRPILMHKPSTTGLSISELLDARVGATVRTTLSSEIFVADGITQNEAERRWQGGLGLFGQAEKPPRPTRRIEFRQLHSRIWSFVALGLSLGSAAYLFRHEIAALISAIAQFLHAKTSALPDSQEVTTAAIGVTSPTTPSAEQGPRLDLVDVSAFAPEGGAGGSEVLVQVFLHRRDVREMVVDFALAADPDAIRRGVATLVAEIAHGKLVDILIEGRDTTIDEPLQSIVWRGEPCAAQFFVTLPETTADRSCSFRVRIVLDNVPIGSLRFTLKVSATTPVGPRSIGIRGDAAARYRRAFLSYATPDRPEVLKRAQAAAGRAYRILPGLSVNRAGRALGTTALQRNRCLRSVFAVLVKQCGAIAMGTSRSRTRCCSAERLTGRRTRHHAHYPRRPASAAADPRDRARPAPAAAPAGRQMAPRRDGRADRRQADVPMAHRRPGWRNPRSADPASPG